jgi:elongation factor Ts
MADCKNALIESQGDMKVAIEILRKKGAASAAKRADRSANEGLIVTKCSPDGKTATIVEINSETDFVARNELFVQYANQVAKAILLNNPTTIDDVFELKVNDDTIRGLHNEILAKFSENIQIRRFLKITTEGYIGEYTHAGSKLAVLVETNIANPSEQVISKIRDIAMQIAAMKPSYIDRESVPEDDLLKEIEIYKEQAITEGKKPEIAERIAKGRLEKFYQDQCLVEQLFVKDPSKTIKDVVAEISNLIGYEARIKRIVRFFLGESLEQ